jgi:hypothetical protein
VAVGVTKVGQLINTDNDPRWVPPPLKTTVPFPADVQVTTHEKVVPLKDGELTVP